MRYLQTQEHQLYKLLFLSVSKIEVIAPALTFHATATPIFSTNATPVKTDCKSDTGNIDPKSIKKYDYSKSNP